MITKMKKISFLILNKEYQSFLEHLRELGIVHVVERQKGVSSDIQPVEAKQTEYFHP